MKSKKLIFAAVLVAVFLVGSVLAASAKSGIRITGGMNYPYLDSPEDEVGWAWANINVTLDPVTGFTGGSMIYRSYSEEKPKDLGGWIGTPMCGAYSTYNGFPAVSLVVQLDEADVWTAGDYIKFMVVDGGQNASEDMVGLIVFPPVPEMPNCDFELPLDIPGFSWYGVNGNLTIH